MIRPVKLNDSSAIQKLNASQLNYDYPLKDTEANLKQLLSHSDKYIMLAETNPEGNLIGYVQAEIYLETFSPVLLNVLSLAVSENYQGQGIGKRLMSELKKLAPKYNAAGIRLNSGVERKDAHEFYERIGYTYTKSQKRFFLKL